MGARLGVSAEGGTSTESVWEQDSEENILGSSWVAAQLAASQEGLRSMKLVRALPICCPPQFKFLVWCTGMLGKFTFHHRRKPWSITVTAWSKAWTTFAARTLGSWARIPLEAWMSVRLFRICVVLCLGSGLATGWSSVQGVLPTAYRLINWEGGQCPKNGCTAVDR
jgi:hypothetical protein